ncbi:MAG: hypothetical protein LUH07_07550, partial [Lachnospiraceae bacterium]|nr:hypothetical protein [Lachnospiraceae bacterium]
DASVEKILYYKKEYCREPSGRAGTVEAKKRADYMRGKSITQISRKLPELGNRPLFVSCPKFQAGQVSNVELESESFAGYMSDKLGGKAIITGINPSEDEIKIVTGETFQYSSVVLGTYNAHLYRGQMAMIQALCRTAIPLTVVALRNPYDLQNIPDCVGQLIAWDYSDMTLEALVPVLAGEQKPEGVLPVRIR